MDTATIVTIITGAATAVGGIFVGKRQERAKARKTEVESDSIAVATTEKAVGIWQELNGQLHVELEKLREQIDELRVENLKLHKENLELKTQINQLSNEVDRLKKMVS